MIVSRAGVLGGKPHVRGTRLTVEYLQGRLAEGATREDLHFDHPQLTREGLDAARDYVLQVVERGVLRPGDLRRPRPTRRQPPPLTTDVFSGER